MDNMNYMNRTDYTDYTADCPAFLENFLNFMRVVKNRSERTCEAYYVDLRSYLRYLHIKYAGDTYDVFEKIPIADTPISWLEAQSLSDLFDYIVFLKDVRNNSSKTRARKISALKQLYSYLYGNAKLISDNPAADLELPKLPMSLPHYLTLEQSLQLLNNVSSKSYERDFCIITLFLNCGMRLSELVGLNLTDYSKENKTLRVLGKGGKERIVYLNDACVEALTAYLERRPDCKGKEDGNALFISSQKRRINKRRVEQIVTEMLEKAGLSDLDISAHKLRHTAATLMYQHGGVDTLVLRDILGHKSIATTEIYSHLSDEQLRKAADMSPLSDFTKDSEECKGTSSDSTSADGTSSDGRTKTTAPAINAPIKKD